MDRSGSNTPLLKSDPSHPKLPFPSTAVATSFARNLAARLAGSYVIYSPGFDDFVTDPTVDGKTAKDNMEAIGNLLFGLGCPLPPTSTSLSCHLVVNHIAGGSPIEDYGSFQGDPWLSFQFFQSGHGLNKNPTTLLCSTNLDTASFAICRAREMALYFRCIGETPGHPPAIAASLPSCDIFTSATIKPATNAEAAYDSNTAPPDTRYGVRNTAYATSLSGSFGFTLGVGGVTGWSSPSSYKTSGGASDVSFLASLLRGAPWTDLTPRDNMIANNPTAEQSRMVMAGTPSYALLYAPNFGANSLVKLDIGAPNALSTINCRSTIKWLDPTSNASKTPTCSQTGNIITLGTPPPCSNGRQPPCDWLLRFGQGKDEQSASNTTAPGTNGLEVWVSDSPDSSASAILAQVLDSTGNPLGDPIAVNADDGTFGKLPTAAQDASGNFLVAWQTEFSGGSLDTISSRWLDANGNPLSDTFQMEPASDGQQAEPAITADGLGNVAVTWTAYALDGASSGIYLLDVLDGGLPTDSPMAVSDPSQVAVSSSQVQVTAQGGLVVAWNGTDATSRTLGVYFQMLGRNRRLIGKSRHVGHSATEHRRLVQLLADQQGRFRIRWESRSPAGTFLGLFEQHFGADGSEDGSETPVTNP